MDKYIYVKAELNKTQEKDKVGWNEEQECW